MKLPKIKNWYHATDIETANKIIESGFIVPQQHKPGLTLGSFFASTQESAGNYLNRRGHKEYVIFKVARTNLDPNCILDNPADKMAEYGNITMRYMGIVSVKDCTIIHAKDDRDLNIPGFKIITNGKGQTSLELVDPQAFENFMLAHPEGRAILEQVKQQEMEPA